MASKSFIQSLSTLRGQDPSPQRVQDNVATALAGFRNGIADGVLATGVLVPVAGGTIRNPLGRQAQGVIVVASNAPCWIALDSSTPTTAVVQVALGVTAAYNSATKRWVITDVAQPPQNGLTCSLWWF